MEKTQATTEQIYNHVNLRLMERHNMSISFNNFLALKPHKIFYTLSPSRNFCTIIINGKEIFAVSERAGHKNRGDNKSYIRTVLPNNIKYYEYPVPRIVRKKFKRLEWGQIVKNRWEEINNISDVLDKNIYGKELFEKYPPLTAYCVKQLKLGHTINMFEFSYRLSKEYGREV